MESNSDIMTIKTEYEKAMREVSALENALYEAKWKLERIKEDYQKTCDHDFIKEDDGDYHRPGYYYTCKHCHYFSRFPKKT